MNLSDYVRRGNGHELVAVTVLNKNAPIYWTSKRQWRTSHVKIGGIVNNSVRQSIGSLPRAMTITNTIWVDQYDRFNEIEYDCHSSDILSFVIERRTFTPLALCVHRPYNILPTLFIYWVLNISMDCVHTQ